MAYLLKNLKIESLALKMSFLGGFLGCSLEKLLSYFKATHTDLSNCKFLSKNWSPYIWDQKCLSGVFYQLKSEKVLSILEKAPSDLSKWQASFKTKSFNVWDQNYLIWLFWAVISKYYFHIWNQHSQVCQSTKFCAKIKILVPGNKNTLFGYFCGVAFKKLSCLKSTLSNLPNCKVSWKNIKPLNLELKMSCNYCKFWYHINN